MKKRLMIIGIVLMMALAFSACGKSSEKDGGTANNTSGENTDGSDTAVQNANTDIVKISQSEIEGLDDNEFYAANSSGSDITEIYICTTGSGEWGSNLISSSIADGAKIKVAASDFNADNLYDIRVVNSNSETTEYYEFDIKATVQVTFYADAQCDVSTI